MGSAKKRPRYNVVSLRISDAEREALDNVVLVTKRSVSQVMREAMEHLLRRAEPCERP
jgi:predicted transcriptional regulator